MKKTMLATSLISVLLAACAHKPTETVDINNTVTEVYAVPDINQIPAGSPQQKAIAGAALSDSNAVGETVETLVAPPKERVVLPSIYQTKQLPGEVIRQGRYALVSVSPEAGQKYLLDQLVEVNLHKGQKRKLYTANVERGLRETLQNTGFSLCHAAYPSDVATLFSLPLPKVHYEFGPMRLREALQMIAGPAFDVVLNDITRTICFSTRPVVVEELNVSPVETITTTTTEEVIEE